MGKFKKGQPKPPGSGRKKTPKQKPKTLREGLEEKQFDLTGEFLKLYTKSMSTKDKLDILKVLARYTQPSFKADGEDLPDQSPTVEPAKPTEKDPPTDEPNAVLQLLEDSLNDPPKH